MTNWRIARSYGYVIRKADSNMIQENNGTYDDNYADHSVIVQTKVKWHFQTSTAKWDRQWQIDENVEGQQQKNGQAWNFPKLDGRRGPEKLVIYNLFATIAQPQSHFPVYESSSAISTFG